MTASQSAWASLRSGSLAVLLAKITLLTCWAQGAVVRGPYLQTATPHSISIRWRTDVAMDSRVRFGFSVENLAWEVTQPAPVVDHVLTLTNLAANRSYYYAIGSSTGDLVNGQDYDFVTPPDGPQGVRIWAIGDCGTASLGSSAPHAVRNAYRNFTAGRRTDVWLMLGDNAYFSGTDQEYQSAVFDVYQEFLRTTPVWPTLGNHETYGPNPDGSIAYFDIFSLPQAAEAGGVASGTERYYSFNYASIHFVCLDSELSDKSPQGPMVTWLQEDLLANNSDWLIAYWHSPPYSRGSHDSDFELNLARMREWVVPVLESYGVDLVLCGHSHNYERSYLMQGHYGNSGTLLPSMILNSGSGRPEETGAYQKADTAESRGAVYVVTGSAGQTGGGLLNHPAMYLSLDRLGSLVIDVTSNRLEATFVRETGAIDDHFAILKGPAAPSIVTQPNDQTAFSGESVTFHVQANGSAPLWYQWRLNGQAIDGANNASLTLPNVQMTQAGVYSVAITNQYGRATSQDAALVVQPGRPAAVWDLSRDFSVTSNPGAVWSYGYKTTLSGAFGLNSIAQLSPAGNGVKLAVWSYQPNGLPQVFFNPTTNTAVSGTGTYPPGSVYFFAGYDGAPQNFGAIRLTVPAGADGEYILESAVRPYVDSGSRDVDYHVVRNGEELFGKFLAGGASSGYTNQLSLVGGDTLDFLIGRGADGSVYASGLLVAARLFLVNSSTNPPTIFEQPQSQTTFVGGTAAFTTLAGGTTPLRYQWRKNGEALAGATNATLTLSNVQLSQAGDYSVLVSNPFGEVASPNATLTVQLSPPRTVWDLSEDFSVDANPGGVWSYGFKTAVNGTFGLNPVKQTVLSGNGVPMVVWSYQANNLPQVFHNPTLSTATSGAGVYPPGSVYYFAGYDATPQNFGAIRLTVPAGPGGEYLLESAVRPYVETGGGDTDYHVVHNGQELFGQFLSGSSRSGYTNRITLAAGDHVDFLVGRGQDGHVFGSGLLISTRLTPVEALTNPPSISIQPQPQHVLVGEIARFDVIAQGTSPLYYRWRKGGEELPGATNAILTITNVQLAQAGAYSVVVFNAYGEVVSSNATLTVEPAPPVPVWDLSRDFSVTTNPSAFWSYGFKTEIDGTFGLNAIKQTSLSGNGVPMLVWSYRENSLPQVFYNPTTNTATSGNGIYPPGSVYYFAGNDTSPQNFGAIRLTVPAGADGEYLLESAVRPYVEIGGGDTDYHVVRNGQELFGALVPGNSRSGYTNRIVLAGGDDLDFLVGRGADGQVFGSGLLISARVFFLNALSNRKR